LEVGSDLFRRIGVTPANVGKDAHYADKPNKNAPVRQPGSKVSIALLIFEDFILYSAVVPESALFVIAITVRYSMLYDTIN
jgi:hypothetical protein